MNRNIKQGHKGKQTRNERRTYYVKGMHCASCEILIEKKLLELEHVTFVDASTSKGRVVVGYDKERPPVGMLNRMFSKEGYEFFNEPVHETKKQSGRDIVIYGGIAAVVILIFLNVNRFGFEGFVNISAGSSLPTFFLLGILAGVSSCAALVGGLILSVSKQWVGIYGDDESFMKKVQPHMLFNAGRIIAFAVFGYILGVFGSRLQLSLDFTAFLVLAVSVIMIILALQMLGVKAFQGFQLVLPKFVTMNITNEKKFKGRYMPFIMGALTFFLPCGFTVTAQGLALISGDPIQAGLIMLFFALGTAFPLLFIGLSSVKFMNKSHISQSFSKFAAIIILFFAAYNINNQLAIIGLPNISDIRVSYTDTEAGSDELAPIIDGKQVIRMDALAYAYEPNYFKVRSGIPVRWEISDKGTSGCTNAIISKNLFGGDIQLVPGEVSIKEFTPVEPGTYKFSCWMGMVSGVIEVIDTKGVQNSNAKKNI